MELQALLGHLEKVRDWVLHWLAAWLWGNQLQEGELTPPSHCGRSGLGNSGQDDLWDSRRENDITEPQFCARPATVLYSFTTQHLIERSQQPSEEGMTMSF